MGVIRQPVLVWALEKQGYDILRETKYIFLVVTLTFGKGKGSSRVKLSGVLKYVMLCVLNGHAVVVT